MKGYNHSNPLNFRYVLTAAHCVANLRRGTRLVSVRLGEYDVEQAVDCQVTNGEEVCAPPVQDIRIDRIIPHPGFNNPRWANDIALLRLAAEPDFSEFAIAPICLPVTNELINLPLSTLTVTGWGTTETLRRSNKLLKANLPFVQTDTCEKALKIRLTPGQFCAGGEGLVDSCGGDSGEYCLCLKQLFNVFSIFLLERRSTSIPSKTIWHEIHSIWSDELRYKWLWGSRRSSWSVCQCSTLCKMDFR